MKEFYESPLSSRYASEYMLRLFSPDKRYGTWRRLWVALACAEHRLGLPVTDEQVAQLEAHVDDEIDYAAVAEWEKKLRHDVMAHIHVYGESCPDAAGIIHLGATSCYVTDNADIMIYRDALLHIRSELVSVIAALCDFAYKYRAMPTLGYTHFQPAQLVTVGKRACLWAQDFLLDLDELNFVIDNLLFHGCRGTTGTDASFLSLFDGDVQKVRELNAMIAEECGFSMLFPVAGQTYPRKYDSRILNVLSAIAAYKRNPMRCERICSLSRYIMADALNAPMTASTQWFERTLDDSANRRISLPEGFLACDAVLRLMRNVTAGIHVNEKIVERTVLEYLPFIATENLLMSAVRKGGDRQELHEVIRTRSMEATARMKEGLNCDLLDRLALDPAFPLDREEITAVLDPAAFIGICPEQVEEFVAEARARIADCAAETGDVSINV